jgi:hypothetical protein
MLLERVGPMDHPFRLPLLQFIDRKGMIRAQFTGEDSFFNDEAANMRKTLERLLDERVTRAKSRS